MVIKVDSATDGERISVLEDKCIGAGNCVEAAEKYFDQDDDTAKVVLLRGVVEPGDGDSVRRAVNVCPVAAILLHGSGA